MKYLILMYGAEARWDGATAQEQEAWIGQHQSFSAAVAERGHLLGGEALASADTATTLRPVGPDGLRTITEGPFVETVEQLGGFYLVEADDLDSMIELAGLLPDYYELEIRPVSDQ